jgi:hypothetical protein
MADSATDTNAREITIRLMRYYNFDLDGQTAEHQVDQWLNQYPSRWLQPAVVEALYQGRYKAISVEQILTLWCRRDRAFYHFNGEFERIVCSQFSEIGLSESLSHASQSSVANRSDLSTSKVSTSAEAALPSTQQIESPTSAFAELTEFLRKSKSTAPNGDMSHRESGSFSKVQQIGEQAQAELSDESDAVLPFEHRQSASKSGDRPSAIPSSESGEPPIPPFKPNEELATDTSDLIRLTDATHATSQTAIHQFVPTTRTNHFYSKLKAVIQRQEKSDAASSSLVLTRDNSKSDS